MSSSEQPSLSILEVSFVPWIDSIYNQQMRRKERKELPRMAGAES
jgi:hypothetical protein